MKSKINCNMKSRLTNHDSSFKKNIPIHPKTCHCVATCSNVAPQHRVAYLRHLGNVIMIVTSLSTLTQLKRHYFYRQFALTCVPFNRPIQTGDVVHYLAKNREKTRQQQTRCIRLIPKVRERNLRMAWYQLWP